MLVLKFGGTSLKDAAAIRRTIAIVEKVKNQQPLVVLSATAGTTDNLLELADSASKKKLNDVARIIKNIETKHKTIAANLIDSDIEKKLAFIRIEEQINDLKKICEGISLLGELTQQMLDSIASSGELLSSGIFEAACRSAWLDSILIDARLVLKIDTSNEQIKYKFLKKKSEELFISNLNKGKIVITQGFIGSDEKNRSTTLGRGGSDYSASLFGAAISADEIQIWTDVSGVMSSDPKLIPDAETIPLLSFTEMEDMAFYGAKVLHPEAIKPALEKNIPVRILNTFDSSNPGTTIIDSSTANKNKLAAITGTIKSVILKNECSLISLKLSTPKKLINNIKTIWKTLEKFNLKVYNFCWTARNLQIITDANKHTLNKLRKSLLSLSPAIEPVALLCLVGENLNLKYNSRLQEFIEITELKGMFFSLFSTSVILIIHPEKSRDALKEAHTLLIKNVRA